MSITNDDIKTEWEPGDAVVAAIDGDGDGTDGDAGDGTDGDGDGTDAAPTDSDGTDAAPTDSDGTDA